MTNKFIILIPALVLCALPAGCTPRQQQSPLANTPPAYQAGYANGCSSGKAAAGNPYNQMQKDVVRFSKDKFYAQGWTDGYDVCKTSYQGIMNDVSRF